MDQPAQKSTLFNVTSLTFASVENGLDFGFFIVYDHVSDYGIQGGSTVQFICVGLAHIVGQFMANYPIRALGRLFLKIYWLARLGRSPKLGNEEVTAVLMYK